MDRIALVTIIGGLGLIVALLVSVLGQPVNAAVPGYAAVAAAFAGIAIVVGLVVLERHTKGPLTGRAT